MRAGLVDKPFDRPKAKPQVAPGNINFSSYRLILLGRFDAQQHQ